MDDFHVDSIFLAREFRAEVDAANAGLTRKRQHAAARHDRADLKFGRRRCPQRSRRQTGSQPKTAAEHRASRRSKCLVACHARSFPLLCVSKTDSALVTGVTSLRCAITMPSDLAGCKGNASAHAPISALMSFSSLSSYSVSISV